MRIVLAAVLFLGIAAAQTFQLGSSSDPCTGGTTWSTPPLRYGSFTCTFNAPAPGNYIVRLDFQEPTVVATGQRSFDVFVNDQPSIAALDLVAAGATTTAITISRAVSTVSLDGKITVRVQTEIRNGILSAVTITPAGPDLSAYVTHADLSAYVPYTGAQQDLNLGPFRLYAGEVVAAGSGGGLYGMNAATIPISTTADDGTAYDFVLYVDPADGGFKMLTKAGVTFVIQKQ